MSEAATEADHSDLPDLPDGWHWSSLGEISEKPQYGWTTKANHETGEIKLLRTTDITSGELNWNTVPFCTEVPENLAKYQVNEGDIFISRAGSVGFSYLVQLVEPAVFASYLIRFRFEGDINKKYVYYYLKSPRYWLAIGASASGIAVPNVNAKKLAAVPIPIAPRDRQDRIVAEIEKQFSRLDEAVASLKRVKANLKRYKAAVLKAAVEGKLTEEWRKRNPDVEPASKLLERILAERRSKWEEAELAKMKAKGKEPKSDKWKEKYRDPLAVEPKELENLPEGYIVVPLDALCSQIGDVDHKMPKKQEKGVPYISTKDFLDNGDIDFDKAKLISENDYLHLCRKIYPEKNDVLLSRYGTVGEVRLVATDRKFQASYSVAIIKPVVNEISGYLAMVLQTHPLQKQIKKHTRSTAQPDLGLGHIREFEVPIPPIGEQEKIMEEVNDRVSLFNRLENEIDAATIKASKVRQSIITQAFDGRLSDMGQG